MDCYFLWVCASVLNQSSTAYCKAMSGFYVSPGGIFLFWKVLSQLVLALTLQLSKSSHGKNGGAYFSAVCGSNLVPVSATEGHGHRVCYRLLGFFSRAHFSCFPEVCRAQSWTACRLILCKYGWKDEKYLWAPKTEAASCLALSTANFWETKKVSAREKTKQPIADSVPMCFCSTNWN